MAQQEKKHGEIFYVKVPNPLAKKINKIIEKRGCTKNWLVNKAIAYCSDNPETVFDYEPQSHQSDMA